MTPTQKVIEKQALLKEASVIEIEIKGMEAANTERIYNHEAIAYSETNFYDRAIRMREIVKKLRDLI